MLKRPANERGIFEFDFSTKFHDKLDKFFFVDSYYYFLEFILINQFSIKLRIQRTNINLKF